MAARKKPTERQPRPGVIARLLALPRPARMLLAAVPALAVVLIVQPVVDSIYLRFFFNDTTIGIPAWLIAGLSVLMYFAGWVFLVGMPGTTPERSRGLTLYLIVSILLVILTPSVYIARWLISLN